MKVDRRLQQMIDLAILKQAVRDLWLRSDGFQMTAEEQEQCIDLMLDAARWCFVDRNAGHVFSFRQICERFGIDPARTALKLFRSLPPERKREIWRALRHYPTKLLPRSWQVCQQPRAVGRRPKGTRYL